MSLVEAPGAYVTMGFMALRNSHPGLAGTAAAARAVGISAETLSRWAGLGDVTPAGRTEAGHARWDVDELQGQLERLAGERERASAERSARRDHLAEDRRDELRMATYVGGPLDGQPVRQGAGRWCTYRDGTGARASVESGHRVVHRRDMADRKIYAVNMGGDQVFRYLWQADPP